MKLETAVKTEFPLYESLRFRKEKDSGEVEIKTDSKILKDMSLIGISGGVIFIGYLTYELFSTYSF